MFANEMNIMFFVIKLLTKKINSFSKIVNLLQAPNGSYTESVTGSSSANFILITVHSNSKQPFDF